MQFREIEFTSRQLENTLNDFRDDSFARRLQKRFSAPSLSDEFFALLQRRGRHCRRQIASGDGAEKIYGQRTEAVLEVLHFEERYEEFQLAEALLEHDEYFSLWRSHHIKMVERMVEQSAEQAGLKALGTCVPRLIRNSFRNSGKPAPTWTSNTELGLPFSGASGDHS